ncbi:hypothetical protein ACOSQ2_024491 [Xanthoceras sorbifolium]
MILPRSHLKGTSDLQRLTILSALDSMNKGASLLLTANWAPNKMALASAVATSTTLDTHNLAAMIKAPAESLTTAPIPIFPTALLTAASTLSFKFLPSGGFQQKELGTDLLMMLPESNPESCNKSFRKRPALTHKLSSLELFTP